MCGSPTDLLEAKNGTTEADSSDIVFLLIDLYKSVVHSYCLFSLLSHKTFPDLCKQRLLMRAG